MNKKECNIIQDLLPNYIEGLTNEETNRFVEKHLKECKECNNTYLNMKENFYKKEEEETKNVNFLKKHRKQIKILRILLLIVLVILLIIIFRKALITIDLNSKSARYQEANNYYIKINSYQGDAINILECYYKDGDYLSTLTRYSNIDEEYKITSYKKGEDEVCFIESEKEKFIQQSNLIAQLQIIDSTPKGFLNNIIYALSIGINSEPCNGKETYKIDGLGALNFVDKETGLVVRSMDKTTHRINSKTDLVVDYEYKFNTVQDSDIQRPDTTDAIV